MAKRTKKVIPFGMEGELANVLQGAQPRRARSISGIDVLDAHFGVESGSLSDKLDLSRAVGEPTPVMAQGNRRDPMWPVR